MAMKLPSLIQIAQQARLHARAEYSGFKVGAALETRAGKVYGGCNIENSTYGLSVCAERVAIWKALSEGETSFRRMVVVADSETLTPPCGACRQIIWEYCGNIAIVLSNLSGKRKSHRMSELFPLPFDDRVLGK
jgi:cytidine deaminase